MREGTRASNGFLYGLSAYLIWGLFPLYWQLLQPASSLEILAHRIAWSVFVMVALLFASRRVPEFRAILASPRTTRLLVAAAVLVSVNWGTYIWGVNNGHVVETALGYFINPLVNVSMGVVIMGERLRKVQWIALAFAFVAVLVLAWDYGRPPYVALTLAFSFALYGLLKKKADVDAIESLTFETLLISPVAFGYLIYLGVSGQSAFGSHGVTHALLLASTGIATAGPLLMFGAAAIRVKLSTLGLLQYIAPTSQFVIGLIVFHETMTHVRWIGFVMVWIALAIFTADALRHYRNTR
ncbi:MAG: EamA family transporter RarD [Marmoricola sp.]